MISEGSCDTEGWSNDAENSAFTGIKYILKYIWLCNDILLLYFYQMTSNLLYIVQVYIFFFSFSNRKEL